MQSVTNARAVVAARKRHKHPESEVAAAEADLRAAKLAQAIERTLAAAPPLTPQQRMQLASLLVAS